MSKNVHLSDDAYYNQFSGKRREKALERAWKNRDFEIELYWKRATYFWTFLVATFAGYFLLLSRPESIKNFKESQFIIIGLGYIFSLAWYLANIGSKKWQENWEKHIDMLEEGVTGNIYKTVLDKTGYSVSGLNQWSSLFVMFIWVLLGIYFFSKNGFSSWSILLLILVFIFTIILLKERKRSPRTNKKEYDGTDQISFTLRRFKYKNP